MTRERSRLRTAVGEAGRELRALRHAQRTRGLRVGTVEHVRDLLGLTSAASTADLAAVQDEVRAAVDQQAGSVRWSLHNAVTATNMAIRQDAESAQRDLHESVWTTMAWFDLTTPASATIVTVVLASRDRPELLRRATESVLAQQHERFELLIVDDSVDGSAKPVLDDLADPRIAALATHGAGVACARNTALAVATGDVVAYLDDDNVMHPGWLRAVAWAFDQWPDTDVVYGARILDHAPPLARGREVPALEMVPWDRQLLETYNFIDLNVLAHRRQLQNARFDETIDVAGDWDLALRLTEHGRVRELPHLACAYTTSSAERLTASERHAAGVAAVRTRLRERDPLRVLLFESQFPLLSETYIEEDRRALVDAGADVAVCRDFPTIAPMPGVPPSFTVLDDAVRAHRPDVLLVHWGDFALGNVHRFEALGVPFAVRIHSFDFSVETVTNLAAHPLCVGVWVHETAQEPLAGIAHPYRPMLWPPPELPSPPPARDLVLSVSAGLPKKDWPTLLAALAALAADGIDARAVAGMSLGLEQVPSDIARLLSTFPQAPLVQINVPRTEVFALLARTALLVYTLDESAAFGMPMSVIEGLCAGASVVVPDRPGVEHVAGPHVRRYRTVDDIVAHAREALAGGPAVEAERRANRELGLRTYADPVERLRIHDDLRTALARWQAAARA